MSVAAPISACPGCAAAPLARNVATQSSEQATLMLSLPGIHCAGCIAGVERALMACPGVREARVNLSLKQVRIIAPDVTPEALIEVLEQAGFEALPLDGTLMGPQDADPAGHALLIRLAVAGFAMMNVMLFSVAVWSGAAQSTQVMFHWLSAAIAVPALGFSAQVFFRSAWRGLSARRLNMDVPISLAILLAAALSMYETAQGGGHVYFDAALSLTFFLLVGRYLDHRTRMAARSASQELTALEAPRAIRLQEGRKTHVNVADLAVGDEILVPAGMRIPVDGQVLKGRSDLDRALLTGESLPVAARPGSQLCAGEVNLTAPLHLRVSAVGQDTSLRRMAAMVEMAEGARNRYTALADRAAQIYAPAVHLLALVTFIGWVALTGELAGPLNIAISVLIITCPCALGLAVPAVMTAATGQLFRNGLLVKDGTALERLARVDHVIFDKTGTLTNGQARLDLARLDADAQSVLAALAASSDHPVSRAISQAIPENVALAELEQVVEHPGRGVEAVWRGQRVRLGQGSWLCAPAGPALKIGDAPAVILAISETLREGAVQAVDQLRAEGLQMEILSGDTQPACDQLALQLQDMPCHGGMRPEDKQRHIEELSEAGAHVLMVGDGLNDTGALAQAYASISPASALDASRAASDIVLLGATLEHIPRAIHVAQSARKRVIENFAIAAGYNMIAIPVAVLGFATPLSAAIAMSASSITVLLNAMRLR